MDIHSISFTLWTIVSIVLLIRFSMVVKSGIDTINATNAPTHKRVLLLGGTFWPNLFKFISDSSLSYFFAVIFSSIVGGLVGGAMGGFVGLGISLSITFTIIYGKRKRLNNK